MKKSTVRCLVLLLGTVGAAAGAVAHESPGHRDGDRATQVNQRDGRTFSAQAAPEISAGSLFAALTLLGGGLIVLRTRR